MWLLIVYFLTPPGENPLSGGEELCLRMGKSAPFRDADELLMLLQRRASLPAAGSQVKPSRALSRRLFDVCSFPDNIQNCASAQRFPPCGDLGYSPRFDQGKKQLSSSFMSKLVGKDPDAGKD